MTKRKLTAAIMDEWRKHDAGQGVPYIKWAELAASVLIKESTATVPRDDEVTGWYKDAAKWLSKPPYITRGGK